MKCILHIGTEKTGTTLLQRWLYENESALSLQGIGLPKAADFPNNRKLVAFIQSEIDDYLTKRQVTNEDQRAQFYEGFEEDLLSEIRDLSENHHTVIFTSEHFHSRLRDVGQISSLKKILEKAFSDIKVVCYFREQSKVRLSLYSTALKNGERGPIHQYHNRVNQESHYYNYLLFFSKWEEVFGSENLVPRLFEKSFLRHGDIRHDFILSTCPCVDPDRLTFETDSANVSLTAKQAYFFRTINMALRPFSHIFPNPLPRRLKDRISELEYLRDGEGVVDPRSLDMYRLFDVPNKEFFRKFFGADCNLFDEPDIIGLPSEDMDPEEFSKVLREMLSLEGVAFITDREINTIKDVAIRLYEAGDIDVNEAINLLKVAQRARPAGHVINSKLSEYFDKTR